MKTRDRILAASQELFNTRGERPVTTNHIAAHLGISPGNLYYHFKNKAEIIRELYVGHQHAMLNILELPEDRHFTMSDKAVLMERLFTSLWEYRFIYRDSEHMLAEDMKLEPLYAESFRFFMEQSNRVHKALADAGLQDTTPEQRSVLSYNAWITIVNWISFVRCCILQDQNADITPELVKRGVYQVLAVERAYMTEKALEQMSEIEALYYCDLEAFLPTSANTSSTEQKTI